MPSNPAEELLAAVKEHATAGDDFAFYGYGVSKPYLYVPRQLGVRVHVQPSEGRWVEYVNGADMPVASHASASSAVYSAFLRARGKQQA